MGSDVAECKATGLGCISPTPPNTTGVHDPASLWGYNVGDEPGLIQFAQHAALFKTIRQLRPGSMGFANLLESYCPSGPSSPKTASRSLRRALLMTQVNTGSLYRYGKRT